MCSSDLADLINTIKKQNPSAIGLDLFRDFPVEPGNKELTQVFKTTPDLIGIEKRSGNRDRSNVNPSQVLKALGQTSSNNILIDGDGKLRRAMMYWTTPDGSESLESLGLRLALIHLEKQGITPIAASETDRKSTRLNSSHVSQSRMPSSA